MARGFLIAIFGRGILPLRDIPTIESCELEQVVNALVFIGIFSIGMLFPRKIDTLIVLTFSIIDFLYRDRKNLEARKALKFVQIISTIISVTEPAPPFPTA